MPDQEPHNPHLLKLYERVTKTAAARFNASRRLRQHNAASLWTISLFSLGLIIVSLLQALSFALPFSDKAVNLGQVTLSMIILMISVILTMNNYGLRAEKLHTCGLEMNELALRLERVQQKNSSQDEHSEISHTYSEILRRYDNHDEIDYEMMKLQKPEHYKLPRGFAIITYIHYAQGFLIYVILMFLEVLWIYALLSRVSLIAT